MACPCLHYTYLSYMTDCHFVYVILPERCCSAGFSLVPRRSGGRGERTPGYEATPVCTVVQHSYLIYSWLMYSWLHLTVLTLGAHAHEGYSTYFVCMCVKFAAFISSLYSEYDIPARFSPVFLRFKFCRFRYKGFVVKKERFSRNLIVPVYING